MISIDHNYAWIQIKVQHERDKKLVSIILQEGMNAYARLSTSENGRDEQLSTSRHERDACPSPPDACIKLHTMQFSGSHAVSRNVSKLKHSRTSYYYKATSSL